MKFIIAVFVMTMVTARGEKEKGVKEAEPVRKMRPSFVEINSFAEMNKKLEDILKQGIEQKAENAQLQKKVEDLKNDNVELRQDVSNLKLENMNLRQEEAHLRKAEAEAELRAADAEVVEADKEVEKKAIQRQRNPESKRQEDVEAATRALILSEIRKYHKVHNNTEELKKLILSEINEYQANGDRRLIGIGGGKAKWDSAPNSYGPVENAFSTSAPNNKDFACGGQNKDGSGYTQPFPQHMWYEFPSSHTPARMSFRFTHTTRPKTWRFIGSRDEGCTEASNWVELCGDMTGDKMSRGETGCDVPKYAREPFRCLGIRTYTNENSAGGGDKGNCLKAMRFWETGLTPV